MLSAMIKQLEQMRKDRVRNGQLVGPASSHPLGRHKTLGSSAGGGGGIGGAGCRSGQTDTFEIVALHISPDLGERIMMSAERTLLDEIFPETTQAVQDVRSNVSWNQMDGRQIIRFPLNGYCKLNSVQVLTRLLNAGFTIEASTGGGVEGQQFSEYLLVRKCAM